MGSEEDIEEFSGNCYLKTKTESYKKHWMVLHGNELRFYRKQGDEEHKVMHCLAGTYLKEITMDEISEKSKSQGSKHRSKSDVHSQGASSRNASSKYSTSEAAARREKQQSKAKHFHPIKLVIPPNKSRLVFFSKQDD